MKNKREFYGNPKAYQTSFEEDQLLGYVSRDTEGMCFVSQFSAFKRDKELKGGGMLSDIFPFKFVAKQSNPKILNHREATKSDDHEQFMGSMREEVDKLFDKRIYKIVP